MKLSEISMIAQYEPDLSVLDAVISNPRRLAIGRYENKVLHQTIIGNNTVFDLDGVIMLVGQKTTYKGSPAFRIGQTVTKPEFRGKGYATLLYASLIDKHGLTIISDDDLTPGSLRVWNKIGEMRQLFALNIATGEATPVTDATQAVSKTARIVLVCPAIPVSEMMFPVNHWNLLDDTERFTCPTNCGLFE